MTSHSERQRTSILQAARFSVNLVFHVADGEATIKNGPKKEKIRRWKEKPVVLSYLVLRARTLSVQGPVTLSHACVLRDMLVSLPAPFLCIILQFSYSY